jgi:hypothetical protein
MKNAFSLLLALVLAGVAAIAQTNVSKASSVGTWKLDVEHSDFGSQPAPKSLTLTILKDAPDGLAWRVDIVDDKGQPFSYSWSGAADGTMQPIKGADGREIGKESATRENGALLRHGVEAMDGSTFDGRATMSADGNTITDVVTNKSQDGKTSTMTTVMRRVLEKSK